MTVPATLKIENPYWEAVKDIVFADHRPWGVEYQVDPLMLPNGKYRNLDDPVERDKYMALSRHKMVKKYSWTIPDPATLQFVFEHVRNNMLVDPLAGTGYWAYLLRQYGVEVIAADKEPGTNHYHKGEALWCPIFTDDAIDTVKRHQNKTLLLSWVPYSSEIGTEIVKAYTGNRIIYIGEGEYGCCGDDSLFEELNKWDEVKTHRPMQWFGMHDFVTIYDRKAIANGVNTG